MFEMRNGRPSAATVISIVALVFAMVGTAVALPGKGTVDKNDLAKGSVTKKAIKKNAVTGKAIKNGAITDAKIADGAVGTAKIADEAVTDAKVDGVVPAGFAFINFQDEIVQEQSSGIGGMTLTVEGTFVCISGLPYTPRNIQVTVARTGGGQSNAFPNAFVPGVDANTFCTGPEQASLQFINDGGTALGNPPPFYVTFFK